MNIMLVAVTVVSLVIGQVPTAILVALLVLLNVVLGTRQELAARASVDSVIEDASAPDQGHSVEPGCPHTRPRRCARGHCPCRGGRHCPCRRPDHPVCGGPGGAGGRARGRDAEQTRHAYPRLAEVPFDSDLASGSCCRSWSKWTSGSVAGNWRRRRLPTHAWSSTLAVPWRARRRNLTRCRLSRAERLVPEQGGNYDQPRHHRGGVQGEARPRYWWAGVGSRGGGLGRPGSWGGSRRVQDGRRHAGRKP